MQIQPPTNAYGHTAPVTFTWSGPTDAPEGLMIQPGPNDALVVSSFMNPEQQIALTDAKDGAKFLDLVNGLYDKPGVQIEAGHRYQLYMVHWGSNPRTGEYRQYPESSAPAAAVEAATLGRAILAQLAAK